MISIQTNMNAKNFLHVLNATERSTEQSIQRLSTGKRINLADDGVANFSMKTRLTSEIVGKSQGLQNTNKAISALKTVESASNTIVDLLMRSKELSTEALNDGYTEQQRIDLNREWIGNLDEIRRIAANTEWNDGKLLAAGGNYNVRVDENTTVSGPLKDWTVNNANAATGALGGNTFMSSVACPLCGGDDLRHNFRRDDGGTRDCVKITSARIEDALESAITENTTLKGYVNNMEVTAETLSASVNNLSNSLGAINDTDHAAETSHLAKSAIISKASTALLAQGDQDHQLVSMLLE
tara:strand:+ start:1821 stop:2711 length:891 start_codon:yes stop_codon:yes gene_type:complete